MKRRWTDALPLAAIALLLALVVPQLWHQDNTPQPRPDSANIPQSRPTSIPTENWRVIKVADGDTITVTRGSLKEKIWFCGIDSPEKSQPLGQESKANLQRLVDEANGQVQLSVIERDRYGRSVAEVFAGGK